MHFHGVAKGAYEVELLEPGGLLEVAKDSEPATASVVLASQTAVVDARVQLHHHHCEDIWSILVQPRTGVLKRFPFLKRQCRYAITNEFGIMQSAPDSPTVRQISELASPSFGDAGWQGVALESRLNHLPSAFATPMAAGSQVWADPRQAPLSFAPVANFAEGHSVTCSFRAAVERTPAGGGGRWSRESCARHQPSFPGLGLVDGKAAETMLKCVQADSSLRHAQ